MLEDTTIRRGRAYEIPTLQVPSSSRSRSRLILITRMGRAYAAKRPAGPAPRLSTTNPENTGCRQATRHSPGARGPGGKFQNWAPKSGYGSHGLGERITSQLPPPIPPQGESNRGPPRTSDATPQPAAPGKATTNRRKPDDCASQETTEHRTRKTLPTTLSSWTPRANSGEETRRK